MTFRPKPLVAAVALALAASGCTTIVRSSSAPNGAGGNGDSRGLGGPSLSNNGRYVAFNSTASNLVAGDTNGVADAFRRDNVTGETIRVSVANDGSQISSASGASTISGNGDHVIFTTAAALEPADTNGTWDVYVRSITAGTTEMVSILPDGSQLLGVFEHQALGRMSLSDDGRYALVTDSLPGTGNAYLRDLQTNTTKPFTGGVDDAFLSGDAKWIVVNGLCTGGPCLHSAVFISTGTEPFERISEGCGFLVEDVTANARYVVGRRFGVYNTFVCPGPTGLVRCDRQTQEVLKIPVANEPAPQLAASRVSISNDGRFVALRDGNGVAKVVDLRADTTQVLDTDFLGEPSSEPSEALAISGSGRYVSLSSSAVLTADDANGLWDVFTRYSVTPVITNVDPVPFPRGAHFSAIVRGSGFLPGATAAITGDGVTVHDVTLLNSKRAYVEVTVDPAATPGPRDISIINTGGFGSSTDTCTGCFVVG